jgi:hypothetical protein
VPEISVTLNAVRHYNVNTSGDSGLYMLARVTTRAGGAGVAGRSVVVNVRWVIGGVVFDDVITVGPTDANGFARVCPGGAYLANTQITVDSEPVFNFGGPEGPALSGINVLNQLEGATPSFCQ